MITEIDGLIYECTIQDLKGKTYTFFAHGLSQVTGELGRPLEKSVMKRLFPNICGAHDLTSDSQVDYLIGLGKASWQPTRIQKAEGGGDFWLWQNAFGSCVGGSHPLVNSFTCRSDSLYTVLKTIIQREELVQESWKIPSCRAYSTKVSITECGDFFNMEKLGTVVEPRCGSCKCGKCPVPGSRYSFREESELKLIDENLSYDEESGCWVTKYPFLFPKDMLKGSKEVAMKSMVATERTLRRKGDWAQIYQDQIDDMVTRGVARIVPSKELESFKGTINYLPHLAAVNPRSQSTPVRIVFDASRAQGGGPSLNQILAKGPDRFLNNLAGVILNFRSGRIAVKGDVRKMYNCVKLTPEDSFTQCFLWRDMESDIEPRTYQVIVNNIGVKPAGAIATVALGKSTEIFSDKYPVTSQQLREKSYVDDIGLTAKSKSALRKRILEADEILGHANMRIKKWVCSGDSSEKISIGDASESAGFEDSGVERMLE